MRVFITGWAWFIGSHLSEKYISWGHEVIIYDNLSTGNLGNLHSIRDWITFIKWDIRDLDLLTKSMKNVDLVIHLAAIVSVQQSIDHPYETHEVTAGWTLNILESARVNNILKVLIASSAAVYGEQLILPITETAPLLPMSPYAIAKLMSEKYWEYYSYISNMNVLAMRFFNVYWPRQDPKSSYAGVISKFIESFQNKVEISVFGNGEQTRDFIYVLDLCDSIYKLWFSDWQKFWVVNVGNGTSVSLNQLLSTLKKITNRSPLISYKNSKNGDIVYSCADISKLRSMVKCNFLFPLEKWLKNIWNWKNLT